MRRRPSFLLTLTIGIVMGWIIRGWNEETHPATRETMSTKLAAAETKVNQLLTKISESAELQTKLTTAENKITHLLSQVAETVPLQEKLQSAEAEIKRLKAELSKTKIEKPSDDLTKINGIGPAFAKRLYKADIHTFAQLATLSQEAVRKIVAAKNWQKIEPEAWIEQAKQLSTKV